MRETCMSGRNFIESISMDLHRLYDKSSTRDRSNMSSETNKGSSGTTALSGILLRSWF